MSVWELFLIAFALAVDCFTVSIAAGVIAGKKAPWPKIRMAVLFGGFQALMPLLGWGAAFSVLTYIERFDHWIAFALLTFLGVKMILNHFKPDDNQKFDPMKLSSQLILAVATSIDALAVGLTFACTGYQSMSGLAFPLALIGVVSFVMTILGLWLGRRFGSRVSRRFAPEIIGGAVLIFIGVKILLEHLLS